MRRKPRRGPERIREAQKGSYIESQRTPRRPREILRGPKKPRFAPEIPRQALRGPESPRGPEGSKEPLRGPARSTVP